MTVTIELPEDVSAAREGQWGDVTWRSLEAVAVEGYRTGALTESQVRRLLQLETRFQVHALLKARDVPLRRRSNMRRHTLGQHLHPLAADVGVAVPWELEMPALS